MHIRTLTSVALAAVAYAGLGTPAQACDSTGCLILTRGPSGLLRKGGFSLDLSYRYLDQSRRLRGRDETDVVSRPRVDLERGRLLSNYHRDLDADDSGVQLEAGFGVSSRTTLYASAPVLTLKSHRIGHGSLITPYDTWGFGDVVAGARQAIPLPFAGSAVASLALKLPTGKTDLIDEFDGQPLDPMLQPGTGSLDVLFGGYYSRKITSPRLDVSVSGSYQANTTNGRGYRFGNQAIASFGLSRPLGGSLVLSAQAKWMREGRDAFRGLEVPSTGTTFAYVTGGLRFFHGSFSYYAIAHAPFYRNVNETQLGPRAGVLAGLSRTF